MTDEPELSSCGNPRIPKGDGEAVVQAYLDAMPGWKHAVGRRLDELVVATVPNVRKAVRWNTPFYGVPERGWFFALYCYKKHVQLSFLNGGELNPPPPVESKQERVRYLRVLESDPLDEDQLRAWFRQAAKLPGEEVF